MERALASRTYKASISEAIEEAKKQKKLFVVYVSGEDAESNNLESFTWSNSIVAESLSKYCILLHIQDGSTEAQNFSAIYPYKSVPCITAVGYNGLQVWQNEGFVSAEVVASSLEKGWLSLHIQETTASFLTAALTGKKYEASTSNAASTGQSGQGSSSSTVVPSDTIDKHVFSEAKPSVSCKTVEESNGGETAVEEKNAKSGTKISSESSGNRSLSADEQSSSSVSTIGVLGPALADLDSGSDNLLSSPEGGLTVVEAAKMVMQRKEAESLSRVEPMDNHGKINKPSEVHLNIRLPDGNNLQEKFLLGCTLRLVKDYIDTNKASDIGPYDLAIPYPRQVFSDQDLSKSLVELNLLNRQALIVVPHQNAPGFHGGRSSDQINSNTTAESSFGNNGGYFSYIRRIVSYLNPFSYIGNSASSSSTGEESQSGFWQYSPNSTLQNSETERHMPYSPNRSTSTGRNENRSKKLTTSRYGSNIHTMKHGEDDGQFSDRNSFWNGNSTQYGGDNDGK